MVVRLRKWFLSINIYKTFHLATRVCCEGKFVTIKLNQSPGKGFEGSENWENPKSMRNKGQHLCFRDKSVRFLWRKAIGVLFFSEDLRDRCRSFLPLPPWGWIGFVGKLFDDISRKRQVESLKLYKLNIKLCAIGCEV